jgi:hypothetical protein
MATLYDAWNPVTRRGTEIVTDSETGLPVIIQTQDLKPIIEANKRQANNFDPYLRTDTRHVARIPIVIWQRLMRLGIAKDEKALNRWLDDPDNRVFRTDDGRRI